MASKAKAPQSPSLQATDALPPDASKKPVNKPPLLFKQTQKIIDAIEQNLGGTLVTYWNAPGGSVCQNDVVGFYEFLRGMKGKDGKPAAKVDTLYLFIKSSGGDGTASLRIVHLLRQHAKRVVVLAPMECVSAATMIALGANEIRMGPLAYLSAVDTSLRHALSPVDKDNDRVSVSQNELSRILNVWDREAQRGRVAANSSAKKRGDVPGLTEQLNPYSAIFEHIHPLVIGAVDRASSLSIRLCDEIMSYHMTDAKKRQAISAALNADYPSHAYPITVREAKRVGLNVTELGAELNELLIALNEAYSEMGQRAVTDFDERNYHDNEVLNIIEGRDAQVYFQSDRDWHYRTEERRWISLNDNSSWRKAANVGGKMVQSVFHIR